MSNHIDIEPGAPPSAAVQEPCFRLIYRSRSLLPGGVGGAAVGLTKILKVARTNNAAMNITGALVLYDDWFAQVLEGPEANVRSLFARIENDPRHQSISLREADPTPARLFSRWAMALVAEHGQPDVPLVVASGGLSEAAPWRVTHEQERVLSQLRDMTRGYGRGS